MGRESIDKDSYLDVQTITHTYREPGIGVHSKDEGKTLTEVFCEVYI